VASTVQLCARACACVCLGDWEAELERYGPFEPENNSRYEVKSLSKTTYIFTRVNKSKTRVYGVELRNYVSNNLVLKGNDIASRCTQACV
jgi:hypothetical protein